MSLFRYLRHLAIEPVSLSHKDKAIAALAGFSAILLTCVLTRSYAAEQSAILVASMGASAAILFATPASPLAQPWPFAGGQLISAILGVTSAAYIDDLPLAAGIAAGSAILAMLLMRCLHPPGAATALAPVLSGSLPSSPNVDFVLMPVGINIALMLMLAYLINRLILRRDYPARSAVTHPGARQPPSIVNLTDIDPNDVEQITRNLNHFLDVGNNELLQLFARLQLLSFQKRIGNLSCKDIMQQDIVTVEYGTEIEIAWNLMYEGNLKALPVLDKSRRVIGIVTRYDFFKNLKLTPYVSFQDKWLSFIKRTPDIHTDKPEFIGHIMTRKVKTLRGDSDIAELFPLILDEGHHRIPIVDEDDRFVGMAFHNHLLSAAFKRITTAHTDTD
ncbi:MAG: HPP family protein [Methylomonas sp.]|nr:HPP family protein [Methylomonas sp.]